MNNIATEIVFLIEEDPEGGYTAKGLGESIFTQAEDMASLKWYVMQFAVIFLMKLTVLK